MRTDADEAAQDEAAQTAAHEAEQLYQRHLLRRAQAGDYDAFERLYALLEPGIGRFVRRLVGHGTESEDIVQDTFLALYTHLDNIVPASRLRPYVYRIARNHCYDRLRLWGRYEEVSIDASDGDSEAGSKREATFHAPLHLQDEFSTAPDEAAHWLLLSMEVRSAIDRLPHHQRQTLILYCEEELTYAEIAEVMEVSIGTVKSRLFHAKKTLRGLVRPEVLLAIQQDDREYDDGSPTPMGKSAPQSAPVDMQPNVQQPAEEESAPEGQGELEHGRTDFTKTHAVHSGTSRPAQVA